MEATDLLARWCRRVGVAPGFDDIWGKHHEASEDGLRALLAELGVVDTSAEALRAAEVADWLVPVPAVLGAVAGTPRLEILVRLPSAVPRLRWTLHEETGLLRTGVVEVAACRIDNRDRIDGIDMQAIHLAIDGMPPPGYHRLVVRPETGSSSHGTPDAGDASDDPCTLLVVAPAHCYRPAALQGEGRVWGPAVQLYSLRSARNWGIGDFTDLGVLVQDFGERGAGIVGLNPLHALFPHNPRHLSPYSPSSRSQLNVLYLDVEAIPEFGDCEAARRLVGSPAFQGRLAALRSSEHVDPVGVSAAKFEVLALLYAQFRERLADPGDARVLALRQWQAERGEPLKRHATFEALQARFHAADEGVWGWQKWPPAYRDPAGSAVRLFQAEHADRIDYYAWLQWQADRQLARVAARCKDRGLAVGLYLDLAVSVDRAGSDCWGHESLYAAGASVGAPPDEVSLAGQDWGLPPLKPRGLLADRLAFFRETLRACMRHAGALRIDHVMGLMRLYWIPPGRPAGAGAYVRYPMSELMAVVALESERNRCMVIGEDLGTVEDEMRDALARHEVLSYRLLYFERGEGGAFKPPSAYPREALVAVSTHDLPTLAGWWCGHDIQVRQRLGLYPDPAVHDQQWTARAHDRACLLGAIAEAGLLPPGVRIDDHAPTSAPPPLTPALLEAVHAYVASTPSRVLVMQLEDALGVRDQANLPGTVDQHPNWRQKLPVAVEAITRDARVDGLCARLAALRPHAALHAETAARPQALVPRATYRLQFHKGFTFDDALRVLPYLQRLGISHVYCSPLMRAQPGSLHGYDVVAFDEINPELGGRVGFDRLRTAARRLGLGLLLDVVPNHMGIGPENAWWMDVLENGPASPWAKFFDIDWNPVDATLAGKVLLPVLGNPFGRVLDDGQLKLVFQAERGRFLLRYWDHCFPVDPRTTADLLQRAGERSGGVDGLALRSLATAFARLPGREVDDPALLAERAREKDLLKQRLCALMKLAPAVQAAVEAVVSEVDTPDALDALHEAQAYRLAFWRVASDEINYRRFFDVNELAALRQEDPAVFEATHAFALDLAAAGLVDGLRIDHPDGLHDPAEYFERLQRGYAERAGLPAPRRDESGRCARPLYVVAEKIAAGHEDVPDTWAVHGTTGYRFANVVNGVLVDTRSRERLDRVWRRASGEPDDFHEMAYLGKRAIMRNSLASELTVLATELLRIARAHRHSRDATYNALREVLAEVAACMPVYRTYVVRQPSSQDERFIDWAIGLARRRSPGVDASLFDFVRQTLLAQALPGADAALAERVRRFAMRFQQFTSPVAAKGVEDTAFYRYHRLIPLNEVGGEPGTFGLSLRGFHAANGDRAARWPHSMIATSTHDNKRSEDVRCRLDVLSEMPTVWPRLLREVGGAPQLQRVRVAALGGVADADGDAPTMIPSRSDEILLVQTLLGTLPAGGLDDDALDAYRDRIERYALKCVREAKQFTSWINPDAAYEDGVLAYVRSVLGRVRPNPVLTDLQAHAETLAWFGAFNSASMALLKFSAPGVPDLYQGNEVMDLSLVDPDNRRPVDYAARERLLDELHALAEGADWREGLSAIAATPCDGRLKLWVTWRALAWRQAHATLYRDGGYVPLRVEGERAHHVVAFAREARELKEARAGRDPRENRETRLAREADAAAAAEAGRADVERVVTLAGRFHARLMDLQPGVPAGAAAWGDTRVDVSAWPDGTVLRNALTGETVTVEAGRVPLARVFATLPLALLAPAVERQEAEPQGLPLAT